LGRAGDRRCARAATAAAQSVPVTLGPRASRPHLRSMPKKMRAGRPRSGMLSALLRLHGFLGRSFLLRPCLLCRRRFFWVWPLLDALHQALGGEPPFRPRLAAHRNIGLMHGVRIARNQWMPPEQIALLIH